MLRDAQAAPTLAAVDEWNARWREGRIGFHNETVHPLLAELCDRYLPAEARVLVPLCGKSVDMPYLAGRARPPVVGVELVEQAVRAFYREQGLVPRVVDRGGMRVFEQARVTIFNGDIFDLPAVCDERFDWVYDRAALVALPAHRRPAYVETLLRLCQPRARLLLLAIYYDQAQMEGPPYAVPPAEVERLLGAHGRLRTLRDDDIFEPGGRFAQRGLRWMRRAAYLLDREPTAA